MPEVKCLNEHGEWEWEWESENCMSAFLCPAPRKLSLSWLLPRGETVTEKYVGHVCATDDGMQGDCSLGLDLWEMGMVEEVDNTEVSRDRLIVGP